jgi:hypothetical protein
MYNRLDNSIKELVEWMMRCKEKEHDFKTVKRINKEIEKGTLTIKTTRWQLFNINMDDFQRHWSELEK